MSGVKAFFFPPAPDGGARQREGGSTALDDAPRVLQMKNPQAWQALLGGALVHMVLGTMCVQFATEQKKERQRHLTPRAFRSGPFFHRYTWGNVTVYVTSYLRLYDASVTYEDSLAVFAASLAGQVSS